MNYVTVRIEEPKPFAFNPNPSGWDWSVEVHGDSEKYLAGWAMTFWSARWKVRRAIRRIRAVNKLVKYAEQELLTKN